MSDTTQAAHVHNKNPKRFNAIWLIPLGAVGLSLGLTLKNYLDQGPVIKLYFDTASGLAVEETKLKFRDVEVGHVEEIRIDEEKPRVIVSVRLEKEIGRLVDTDAMFWVVRPRLSLSGASGLGTLLSGSYIQGSWDNEPGEVKREFVGLEEPPQTPPGTPGIRLKLRGTESASLSVGGPVFFKGVEVGQVESRHFSEAGDGVIYSIFVGAPVHERISTASKFWSAGGVSVSLNADGIDANIQSFQAFISGGVAFDNILIDQNSNAPEKVDDGAVFRLHGNEEAARNSLYTEGEEGARFLVVFDESVRGLRAGAPVEMRGIRVGEVLDVAATVSDIPGKLNIRAVIELQPRRVGAPKLSREEGVKFLDAGIRKEGLRAKLKSGSLLTGALYVEIVSDPTLPVEGLGLDSKPYPTWPTLKSDLEELTGSIGDLTTNLASVNFNALVGAATRALNDVHYILGTTENRSRISRTLSSVEEAAVAISTSTEDLPKLIRALNQAADSAQDTLSTFSTGSQLHFEAKSAIRELRQAAEAVETFAQTISEKPNAIILGK
ncbi:MAG: MlaD family protein [Myxococcota bacterium]